MPAAVLTGFAGGFPGDTSTIFASPFPIQPGTKARDNSGNEYMFVAYQGVTYYGCLVQIDSLNRATPLLGTASKSFRVGVVMAGGTPTTDNNFHITATNAATQQGGWVQIYGVHPTVQTGVATDAGVSQTAGGNYWAIPQTSVGTPSGTLSLIAQGAGTSIAQSSVDGNKIYNLWVVDLGEVTDLAGYLGSSGASGPTSTSNQGETSGTNTSAFIGQTFACFLNYPYVLGITVPMSDATT